MNISDLLLPEFDQEMSNTRTMLERVPADKLAGWKPHQKSMTMGRLAGHIAELPNWAVQIMENDVLDLTPMVAAGRQGYAASSSEELLQTFEKYAAGARSAIAGASDSDFLKTWSMQLHGKTVLSGRRLEMIRTSFLNHLIHHRGQLGVYLRMNDIPLPAIYGPSADEGKSF